MKYSTLFLICMLCSVIGGCVKETDSSMSEVIPTEKPVISSEIQKVEEIADEDTNSLGQTSATQETTHKKENNYYSDTEKIEYYYDENGVLTEKHHYEYKGNRVMQEQDILTIYIYNTDYPLVIKTIYEDGHGTVKYKNTDNMYDDHNNVKTEYYDTNWNMTHYIMHKWMATPEESDEYLSMDFDDLCSVKEEKRYSPDGKYLGKYIDIYNGYGGWWGYRTFDKNDNLIEYVTKWQYQLSAEQQ